MNPDLSAHTTLSHYRIVSKIGAGGMGEVYLAHDTKLDRKVALKILPADVAADETRMRRFVQEAKTASALNHPNIITIHEIDESNSIDFIATEFIDGETLREQIKILPMKLGEVLDVAVQIASALSAAHAAGIVHRDLKPENAMVRQDGIVKVLDFGLAKLTEQLPSASIDPEAPTRAAANTEPGVVMGTAICMSPEQARGLQVDARTDVFSLGVLVYEMVTGHLPFGGSNTNEAMAAILSDKEPSPIARFARDVPTELERIVSKALRKDRDERYQTIKDMLLDLKSLKQEWEFERKLERSVPPKSQVARETEEQARAKTVIESARSPVSQRSTSRPTIFTKRNLTIIVAAAVIVTLASGAYVYFGRHNRRTIKSIAVMPFVTASGNSEVEYLSDGMTESLINSLSRLPNVSVKSLSSVVRYKGRAVEPQQVGSELSVEAILNGRVVQRGDQLTLSLEFVDAGTGNQIWGEQYNRKLSDLLLVQEEVATRISEQLRIKLSGEAQKQLTRRYTDDTEAYQAYLKGRFYSAKATENGLKKSIEYFNQAIEMDPNYALAWAGLANGYWEDSDIHVAPQDVMPKAKQAAQRALALDYGLAQAHNGVAITLTAYDWDWSNAEQEFNRAIELNPDYPTAHAQYGWYLAIMGRSPEAIAELKQAIQLDPLSSQSHLFLGLALYLARRYDEAGTEMRSTLELEPSKWIVRTFLSWVLVRQGKFSEAIAELNTARQIDDNHYVVGALGQAYALSGKKNEALACIAQLKEWSKQRYVSPHSIAMIYAGLGDKDPAFEWLEKAIAARSEHLGWLKVDPRMDPLRSDPRFASLEQRVGVTPKTKI